MTRQALTPSLTVFPEVTNLLLTLVNKLEKGVEWSVFKPKHFPKIQGDINQVVFEKLSTMIQSRVAFSVKSRFKQDVSAKKNASFILC